MKDGQSLSVRGWPRYHLLPEGYITRVRMLPILGGEGTQSVRPRQPLTVVYTPNAV